MLVIVLFILILNVVSILLMYKCLDLESKKEKLIFIVMGTALMYILTSIVYWISTKNIQMTEVSERGKDLIIFLFVPINAILTLPLFAKSFSKFRDGRIDGKILRNRGIALIILLAIILIFECIYFKNIQQQVVNMITEEEKQTIEKQQTYLNSVAVNNLATDVNSVESNNSVESGNSVESNNSGESGNSVDNGNTVKPTNSLANENEINNQVESNKVTNSVQ